MAYTTTRAERADRSRQICAFVAVAAVSILGCLSVSAVVPAFAQVNAPAKGHLKLPPKEAATPTDNQADKLNEQPSSCGAREFYKIERMLIKVSCSSLRAEQEIR